MTASPCLALVNSESGVVVPEKHRAAWNETKEYGDFHKWGYPNSWMVYTGKSHESGW